MARGTAIANPGVRRLVVRRWVRLALLLVLGSLAAAAWAGASKRSRNVYDAELVRLESADVRKDALADATREARKETLDAMSAQNRLLFEWSVVLLGAAAALVTTSKVHRIGNVETVYVLLAPAAILLIGSVEQGIRFQRSHTFLILNDQLHPPALNHYLFQQGDLMFKALLCLGLFVVVFYLLIVFGGASPTEDAAKTA